MWVLIQLKSTNLPMLDFFSWLNLIYYLVLSLRIKYDDSKNQNNCVMRKMSIMDFWFDQKPQLLTLLNIFFVSMWPKFMYCFVLSLTIKYDDSKNQNNCVMTTISIMIFIRWKNLNSVLLTFPTKNASNKNNILWT